MDKLDKIISETLDDEEREILEKIGLEQSFPEPVHSTAISSTA